ncbi:MAG TPA: hypothetical protein VKS01_01310, partial [Bryobacteraceae bacterium]|nr:hypothetical protein [Bryobacteraceae bacterium]
MSGEKQPYLSVVVTARNDDHGGNLLGRMQAFVNGLLRQCARHQLPAELIFVEWNPPAAKPKLIDALRWPDSGGYCDVRIIEVPAELHQRYRHWQTMPLYQMIAKNVGIRRARGEWVLATNIDILFSDELMEFIARRRLDSNRMYRVDRWDVMPDVPVDESVEDQLRYCESHVLRVNLREGTFNRAADGSIAFADDDIAPPAGPVRLGPGWYTREMSGDEPFRWVDRDAQLTLVGASGKYLTLDVEPGPGVPMG